MQAIDKDKWIDELTVKNYCPKLKVERLEKELELLNKKSGISKRNE